MVDVVQATLFYMNPDAPIPVHSPYSALPYEVNFWLVVSTDCDHYRFKATENRFLGLSLRYPVLSAYFVGRHAHEVLFWPPQGDWSGLRGQDRMGVPSRCSTLRSQPLGPGPGSCAAPGSSVQACRSHLSRSRFDFYPIISIFLTVREDHVYKKIFPVISNKKRTHATTRLYVRVYEDLRHSQWPRRIVSLIPWVPIFKFTFSMQSLQSISFEHLLNAI